MCSEDPNLQTAAQPTLIYPSSSQLSLTKQPHLFHRPSREQRILTVRRSQSPLSPRISEPACFITLSRTKEASQRRSSNSPPCPRATFPTLTNNPWRPEGIPRVLFIAIHQIPHLSLPRLGNQTRRYHCKRVCDPPRFDEATQHQSQSSRQASTQIP